MSYEQDWDDADEAMLESSETTVIYSRFISWMSNLSQAVDDIFRIEYDTETGREVYVTQTESKKQFRITIEPLNAYKDSPWSM